MTGTNDNKKQRQIKNDTKAASDNNEQTENHTEITTTQD